MTWNGSFVAETLNIHPQSKADGYEALLGMALRKNKKRAHLLVSTVLGKHIPQSPTIITAAAQMIAYQMLDYAASPAQNTDDKRREYRQALTTCMSAGVLVDLPERPRTVEREQFTVFGYAETATSLGALVAESLHADYIHSTRYPKPHSVDYGSFDESHSHASVHHITPQDITLLDDPNRVLVLVDDELTTGNTIMNTIRLFESHVHHNVYYVGTLTDLRTEQAHAKFAEFEAELGIKVNVFSLISVELEVPEGSVETAAPVLEELKAFPEPNYPVMSGEIITHTMKTAPTSLSLGVTYPELAELDNKAKEVAQNIHVYPGTTLLVLGVEEDMYFQVLVGRWLEKLNPSVHVDFSSSTRSPVVTFNDPGYAIRERIRYSVPDDDAPRYAYNISDVYEKTVLIFNSVEDRTRNNELITALQERGNMVEIITAQVDTNNLQEPLSAPAFSSYDAEDVQWLLKDLSNAELEGSVEDREEAIQNGGAHYAESLPIEFGPSEAYTDLFIDSLEENKTLIAEAVGVLSEQVYALRDQKPVLVSLARAGVPVGILMKRYLKVAHGYDAPHYAISIVRGKGIDTNALNYIAANHNQENVIFVDGWTGKGAITKELADALTDYSDKTGIIYSPELAVLADPGSCVTIYGTREDYLIPSACLNSTVSGLISRTVLNEAYIGEHDYHGAKFYTEFEDADLSEFFLLRISGEYQNLNIANIQQQAQDLLNSNRTPTWAGWKMVETVSEEYGINNVNLVKPGVGETTRVLLRRVPWRILVRPQDKHNLRHILMLAEERGVTVEERTDLPYACIGLIHPNFNKTAVGFDGGKL